MRNLLLPEEAADILKLKVGTLAQMRWRKDKRLPWIKVGDKVVRYKVEDVEAFIESSRVVEV